MNASVLPHLADPGAQAAVQRSMSHLQKCLSALDQIRGIVEHGSPSWRLADDAIQNRAVNVRGTAIEWGDARD